MQAERYSIDLRNRTPEELEKIAGFAVHTLTEIGNALTSDEMEEGEIEGHWGLDDAGECFEMQHDNMICQARGMLVQISKVGSEK